METMLGSGGDGYGFAGLLDASSEEMAAGSVGLPHQQKQKRQREREGVMMVKEERGGVTQWGVAETKDLIAIRADQEQHDSSTRRGSNNKTVWEAVASRMRELGHRRTAEQCKCKWKNLVNRYKGKETADPENGRQCPFFDELDAVFTERARNMQRLLLESESGPSLAKKKLKRSNADRYSDEELSNDENDSDDESRQSKSKKKKPAAANLSIAELLQEFMRQQQRMAAQWRETMERRAEERRLFEQEWRERMEKLERERMMLDQTLREREEQRRSRAEKRDAVLNTLLTKLIQDEL